MEEKGFINKTTIDGFVEQTKRLAGLTDPMTPSEALAALGGVTPEADIYMLVSEDGTEEVAAVVVDEEVIFTATENDIREGTVAATSKGVTTGTKVIPSYHVTEGYELIPSGSRFSVMISALNKYDFTKLQAIICPYVGSIAGSVAAEKVAIDEGVYIVNSTELIAKVTKDDQNKSINFGITNDSASRYLLRYFTYKENY